ncbi:MAG: 1-acyl-sn-glycerol-3-phosphate acyltransferase [Bacteroidaceae bacterium]|nr:1-acyl-sn-glycerol-3-phosphate acyltransferase [Bacteroidaceae bacterium]
MIILYRLYQLFIAAPLIILSTIIACTTTIIGCTIGKANVWSYYPSMVWGRFLCWIMLLPVKVEGRELLDDKQSYVFVANHQGSYDIFLIYGFLGRSFRWMMKKSLRKTPLIGKTCESAGHIFVDKSGPKAIKKTYEQARAVLKNGVSLAVFPEGARTFDGRMTKFRRGAFQLADELGLPVVPVTIDGCFDVLPRQRGINFVSWHPLRLIIHAPIAPEGQGPENVQRTLEQSYEIIMNDLPPQHQDVIENVSK